MKNSQFRDLTILELAPGMNLAVACDSSASIGEKEHDYINVDPEITAACCLRVPLFELICVNAEPITVIDVIGNELEPTGRKMITGIERELKRAGLSHLSLNGSTEENMLTTMTSLGITVMGRFEGEFIQPVIKPKDILFQLGQPLVGAEVVANINSLCEYSELFSLRKEFAVVDLLPVGSKGMKFEAELMASENNLQINFLSPNDEKLKQSAGPATVVLVAVSSGQKSMIMEKYPQLIEIGTFN